MSYRRLATATMILLCAVGLLFAVPSLADSWARAVRSIEGSELQRGNDFLAFYTAGKLVATGRSTSIYDVNALAPIEHAAAPRFPAGQVRAYLNPPFFAIVFAPLSQLSFSDAFRFWTLFNACLLVCLTAMTWQALRCLSPAWRLGCVAAVLTFYSTSCILREGQFSLLLATSWFSTYALLRSGKGLAAGLAFAPLLIKPELAIPVVLFLAYQRQWRFVVGFAVPVCVLAVVSVALIGLDGALHYPSFLLHIAGRQGYGTNLNGFFGWDGFLAGPFDHEHVALLTLVGAVLSLIGFAGLAIAARRLRYPSDPRFPYFWLALTLATLLADPHLYIPDLILVVPGLLGVLPALVKDSSSFMALILTTAWIAAGLGPNFQINFGFNPFSMIMILTLGWSIFVLARWRRLDAQPEREWPGQPLNLQAA